MPASGHSQGISMTRFRVNLVWAGILLAILVGWARSIAFSAKSPLSVNSGKPIVISEESHGGLIPVLNSSSYEVKIVGGYTSCSCIASFDYPLRLAPNQITEIPFTISDSVLSDYYARWFLDHPDQFELNVHIIREGKKEKLME